jgi:DNA-binding transcriptional MerR regulator
MDAKTNDIPMGRQSGEVRIGQAAKELGVTPQYLRILEYQGRIPPARRDFGGRLYGEFDVRLLKSLGVGTRPEQLRTLEEVLRGLR